MARAPSLIGQQFGRLIVVERAGRRKDGHALWKCKCECGNECVADSRDLRRGHTRSCGCLHADVVIKNLVGKRFERLVVVEFAGLDKYHRVLWKCKCDCGNECVVTSNHLLRNNTRSCGCWASETNIARLTIHEMHGTKIYNLWASLKKRCKNPIDNNYDNYGGRGITVCEEWAGSDGFIAFYNYVSKLEHFGEEGYTLDRINVDGNYVPGNLRWATAKEQARNKRTTVFVEYNGEKMSLKEAAERSGISYVALINRRRRGWQEVDLFKPVRQNAKKAE